MTQKDDVLAALKEFTEEAVTLGQLTNKLLGPGGAANSWGTKTPDATIRRIVRHHPDIETLSRGLYCTADSPTSSFQSGKADLDDPTQHTICQGILVELGNLQGYMTRVAKQDTGKSYIPLFGAAKNVDLGKICTLNELPDFIPPVLLNYVGSDAATIDVTWFDDSTRMPVAMFEVETSTDWRRSLEKFLALQYFHISFCIVSYRDKVDKLLQRPGREILKERVKFVDIGELNELQTEGSPKVRKLCSRIL